jgi:hypothetical protein
LGLNPTSFVLVNPVHQALAPNEHPAPKANGGDRRASIDAARDEVADMGLRTVQKLGNFHDCEQIETPVESHKIKISALALFFVAIQVVPASLELRASPCKANL